MWIVTLNEQGASYGPFDNEEKAARFADFLTREVDPARVVELWSPLTEALNWREEVALRWAVEAKARPAAPREAMAGEAS